MTRSHARDTPKCREDHSESRELQRESARELSSDSVPEESLSAGPKQDRLGCLVGSDLRSSFRRECADQRPHLSRNQYLAFRIEERRPDPYPYPPRSLSPRGRSACRAKTDIQIEIEDGVGRKTRLDDVLFVWE